MEYKNHNVLIHVISSAEHILVVQKKVCSIVTYSTWFRQSHGIAKLSNPDNFTQMLSNKTVVEFLCDNSLEYKTIGIL